MLDFEVFFPYVVSHVGHYTLEQYNIQKKE